MSIFENLRYAISIALVFGSFIVGVLSLIVIVRGKLPSLKFRGRKYGFLGLLCGFALAVCGVFLMPYQKVEVTALPPTATIEINGEKYLGQTGKLELMPSTYTVKVSAPNYQTTSKEIQVPGPQVYSFQLQKLAPQKAQNQANGSAPPKTKPAAKAQPSLPAKQTPQVIKKPEIAGSRPSERLTPISSSQFDSSTAQYAVAGFFEAWQDQDWGRMAHFSAPSWKLNYDDPEQELADRFDFKIIKGVRLVSDGTGDDELGPITAKVQYDFAGEKRTKYIRLVVLREDGYGNPTNVPGYDLVVDPTAALAESDTP